MSIKIIAGALIAVGVSAIAYAMNMSISVGHNVVNLQMLADRQNTLFLAGIILVSGIILLSVERLRQAKPPTAAKGESEHFHLKNSTQSIKSSFLLARDSFSQGKGFQLIARETYSRHFLKPSEWEAASGLLRIGFSFLLASFTVLIAVDQNYLPSYNLIGSIYTFIFIFYSLRKAPTIDILLQISAANFLAVIFLTGYLDGGLYYIVNGVPGVAFLIILILKYRINPNAKK